jgi:hypothetical protein
VKNVNCAGIIVCQIQACLWKSETRGQVADGIAMGILEKGRQRQSREFSHLTDEELISKAIDSGVPKDDLPTVAEKALSETDRDLIFHKIFYIRLGPSR